MVPDRVCLGTGLTTPDVVEKPRVLVFEEEGVVFCHRCAFRGISEQGLSRLLCRVSRTDYG